MSAFKESDVERIVRLEGWIRDLQEGVYVNCVYCGHRYGREGQVPVAMADVLKHHVAQCPAHPMSKCVKALEAASHGLRSYQFGTGAPALAEEMADHIDALLKEIAA